MPRRSHTRSGSSSLKWTYYGPDVLPLTVADMDFNTFTRPAVWGTGRAGRTAASAKVDALSSGGMDDIEIPAFLRKQAD